MASIYIKPRGKAWGTRLYKVVEAEWSYEIIPHLADIDHNKFVIKVSDFDEYCDEYCPCCDTEVVIPSFGVSFCPNCGERILPCSMCNTEYNDCRSCPYESVER